jgi:hypothetical protein
VLLDLSLDLFATAPVCGSLAIVGALCDS